MNSTRFFANHVKVNENEVLVTGGRNQYGPTDSTEILKLGESRAGPDLPATYEDYWSGSPFTLFVRKLAARWSGQYVCFYFSASTHQKSDFCSMYVELQ